VKMSGFEKRRASTMSGGQLQRVALARALAAQPQVLLLDEPLSALDKQLREDMQSELKAIQREVGVTTVSVTHDQSEALSMSDQVVVMNAGRIEQQGTPEDMYSKPASEFLARFLGEVNLLPVDAQGRCDTLGIRDRAHAGRLLVVRPEDFRIDRDGTAPNHLMATVRATQFQGGSVRLEVVAQQNGFQPLVVREAYAGYGSAAKPGDTIRVGWDFSFLHSVERAA
jgi:putative spermidine/putrescine transport system ATP-binding protein